MADPAKEPEETPLADKGVTSSNPETPEGHIEIQGTEGEGMRLFQTSAYKKSWMNKGQAQALGLYWAD